MKNSAPVKIHSFDSMLKTTGPVIPGNFRISVSPLEIRLSPNGFPANTYRACCLFLRNPPDL